MFGVTHKQLGCDIPSPWPASWPYVWADVSRARRGQRVTVSHNLRNGDTGVRRQIKKIFFCHPLLLGQLSCLGSSIPRPLPGLSHQEWSTLPHRHPATQHPDVLSPFPSPLSLLFFFFFLSAWLWANERRVCVCERKFWLVTILIYLDMPFPSFYIYKHHEVGRTSNQNTQSD